MKKQMKLLLLISLLSFVLAGCEDTTNTLGGTSSPDVTVSSSQKAGVDSDSTNSNVDNNVPDAKSSVDSTDDNNSANQNPDANEVASNDASVGDSSVKSETGNNSGTVNSGTGNLTSNNTGSSDGNKENSSAVSSGDSQTQIDSQTGSESDTNAAGEENRSAHEDRSQQPVSYKDLVIGEVAEGNIVTFGHYEQDNNFDNGAEPIEWRVLEVNDGKATLIPAAVLMWGTGEEALAKPAEFYDEAFTDAEKLVIAQQPQLMSNEMIKSYLKLKGKGANPTDVWYYHNDTFLYDNYTQSALACGAKPKSLTARGTATQTQYIFWTKDGGCSYRVSKDDFANTMSLSYYDVAKVHYSVKEAICPYIVINTEGFE